MTYLPKRLFGVVVFTVFSLLMLNNWSLAVTGGAYSPRLAAFGPLAMIAALFILFFPAKAVLPQTTKDKVLLFSLFLGSLALGLLNLYWLDPKFFEF